LKLKSIVCVIAIAVRSRFGSLYQVVP
jgi:hypothetical protein